MTSCVVVDDDQGILEVFVDLLETLDLEILGTGHDGNEAVQLYEKFKPDIVFTDLNMPNFDGLYGIENIKDNYPHAKIIVITGNADVHYLPIFNILNIPVINKPFNVNSIKQTISDVLLAGDDTQQTFEIQYKFKENPKIFSCFVTFEQYRNMKKLPVIDDEITIVTTGKHQEPDEQIQDAIDAASQNDVSKLQNISEEHA